MPVSTPGQSTGKQVCPWHPTIVARLRKHGTRFRFDVAPAPCGGRSETARLRVSTAGTGAGRYAKTKNALNPEKTDTFDDDGHEKSPSDKLRRTGLEPVTFGSVDRCRDAVSDCPAETYDPSSVELGVLLRVLERQRSDLAAVVAAWSTLSNPIRAAILAMVEAAIRRSTCQRRRAKLPLRLSRRRANHPSCIEGSTGPAHLWVLRGSTCTRLSP